MQGRARGEVHFANSSRADIPAGRTSGRGRSDGSIVRAACCSSQRAGCCRARARVRASVRLARRVTRSGTMYLMTYIVETTGKVVYTLKKAVNTCNMRETAAQARPAQPQPQGAHPLPARKLLAAWP